MRLGHANWQIPETLSCIRFDSFTSQLRQFDVVCSVYFTGDGSYLFFQGKGQRVQELEVHRFLTRLHNSIGQINGARPTLSPMFRDDGIESTVLDAQFSN